MGVTGERTTLGNRAEQLVADTRAAGAEHVCVGLGVSQAAHVREIGAYADGAIVGTALVRALTDGGPQTVGTLTRELAAGTVREG